MERKREGHSCEHLVYENMSKRDLATEFKAFAKRQAIYFRDKMGVVKRWE